MNIEGANITEVYVYKPPRTYIDESGLYQTEQPYKKVPKSEITKMLTNIKKGWIELKDGGYVIKETRLYIHDWYIRHEKFEYCHKLDKIVNRGKAVRLYELP